MASSKTQTLIEFVIEAAPAVRATKFMAAASLVVALYDWLLCLGDEVEHIYFAPWTLVKVLYIFIRVVTAGGLMVVNYHLAGFRPKLSDTNPPCRKPTYAAGSSCQNITVLAPLAGILVISSSNFLVMRRVGPLYGNKPVVVYGTHLLFLASYLTTIALSFKTITSMIPITKYSRIGHMCVTTTFIRPSGAIFLGPLVLETVVFAMTAFKVYQAAKISPTHLPPLLHVLFRDGLVYYVVIFCARTLCIIIFFALPFQFMLLGI
ncbi:hypothetical protein FRC18_006761, partial [Serendipita sp. 400]